VFNNKQKREKIMKKKKYILLVDIANHKIMADLWTLKNEFKDEFISKYEIPYKKRVKFSHKRIKAKFYLNELILLVLKDKNIRLKDLEVQVEIDLLKWKQ
jgi:hypothetical protein